MGKIFKALENNVNALETVAAVGTFLRGSSAIDLRRRESIILIVAHELRCSYIRTGHANLASSLSMDPLSIVSNNADVEDAVGAEGAMALRYARLLATGARGRRHFV
jgi:alkylhydroperoxidase family enzyme